MPLDTRVRPDETPAQHIAGPTRIVERYRVTPNRVERGEFQHEDIEPLTDQGTAESIVPPAQILTPTPSFSSTTSTYRTADQRLAAFFDNRPVGKNFSDLDFQQISAALQTCNRQTWSQVPRIYSVLRIIEQLQVLDNFINEGITDEWFPFTINKLPNALSSSMQSQFLDTQKVVYTKGLDLESGGEKRHAHFDRNEILPFRVQEALGEGGHGKVHKIVSLISRRAYARKEFRRGNTRNIKKEIESFLRELQILKRLHHYHCVELVGSYTDPRHFGLIMSPIADCNMFEFYKIVNSEPAKKSILRCSFGCLAAALAYLHEEKVRHRDIKPQNILVKGDRVYLADFGVSLDWMSLSRSTTIEDSAKTWIYCAPEVATYEPRNKSSDVWSLGCVFLEMATTLKDTSLEDMRQHFKRTGGDFWFWKNSKGIETWCEKLRNEGLDWDNTPLDWIARMLMVAAAERPSAKEIAETIGIFKASNPTSPVSFCGDCCEVMEDHSDRGGSDDDEWNQHVTSTDASKEPAAMELINGIPLTPTPEVKPSTEQQHHLTLRLGSANLDPAYSTMQYNGENYLPSTRVEVTVDGKKILETKTMKKTLKPNWGTSPDWFTVPRDSFVKLKVLNSHVTSGPESFGEASLSAKLVNGRYSLELLSEQVASLHKNTLVVITKVDGLERIQTIVLSEADQFTALPVSLNSPGNSKGSVNASRKLPKPPFSHPPQLPVGASGRNKAAAPQAQTHSKDERATRAEIRALKAEREADRNRYYREGPALERCRVPYERERTEDMRHVRRPWEREPQDEKRPVEREVVYEIDRPREKEIEVNTRPWEREVIYEIDRPRVREREIEVETRPIEREIIYERERPWERPFKYDDRIIEEEIILSGRPGAGEVEERPRARAVVYERERSRERGMEPQRRNTVAVGADNCSKNRLQDPVYEDDNSDASDYVVRRRKSFEEENVVRRDSDPEDYVTRSRVHRERSRSPATKRTTPLGLGAAVFAAAAYSARNRERSRSPEYTVRRTSRSRSRSRSRTPRTSGLAAAGIAAAAAVKYARNKESSQNSRFSRRSRSRSRSRSRGRIRIDVGLSGTGIAEAAVARYRQSNQSSDYPYRSRSRNRSRSRSRSRSRIRTDVGLAVAGIGAIAAAAAAPNKYSKQSPSYPKRSRSTSRERMKSPDIKREQNKSLLAGWQPLESKRDVRETGDTVERNRVVGPSVLEEVGIYRRETEYDDRSPTPARQGPQGPEERDVLEIRRRGRETDQRRERSRSVGYNERRRLPAGRRMATNRERSRSLDGGEQKGGRAKASASKKERRDLHPNKRMSVGNKDGAADESADNKEVKSFINKVASGLGLKKPIV